MRKLTVILVVLSLAACSGGPMGDAGDHQAPLPDAKNFNPEEVLAWLTTNGTGTRVAVVDVREPQVFADGHVPGARNIPAAAVPEHLQELQGYDHVVMVCNHGGRSSRAAVACAGAGADAGYLTFENWKTAGNPVSFGGWGKQVNR